MEEAMEVIHRRMDYLKKLLHDPKRAYQPEERAHLSARLQECEYLANAIPLLSAPPSTAPKQKGLGFE